jgi:hypothetical protein
VTAILADLDDMLARIHALIADCGPAPTYHSRNGD